MNKNLHRRRWIWAIMFAFVFGLVLPSTGLRAQSDSPSPKPPHGEGEGKEKPPHPNVDPRKEGGLGDGDRPSTYPRIVIKDPGGAERRLSVRAYLLDFSAAMNEQVESGGKKVSRLSLMRTGVKESLDLMLRDRRDLLFNLSVYGGTMSDMAGKAVPFSPNADSIKQAKDWLDERKAEGGADLYAMLKDVFESDADEARLFVGSLPSRPADASEKELAKDAKADAIQDFIVEAVTAWRKAGKKTRLDIVGYGLSEDAKAFYKRLAKAGGGAFL